MVELVSFTAVVSLCPLVTLLIKLLRILLGRYVAKGKLFSEKFVPVTRAGVFRWENFHHRLPRSGQPGLSYKHIKIFIEERVARRDLGNGARLTWLIRKEALESLLTFGVN